MLQEEHYISKLQFSWPQVSCVSGYPARGSRILFVSYLDSSGKVIYLFAIFPFEFTGMLLSNSICYCGGVEDEPCL